jgi:hypothetical protein
VAVMITVVIHIGKIVSLLNQKSVKRYSDEKSVQRKRTKDIQAVDHSDFLL